MAKHSFRLGRSTSRAVMKFVLILVTVAVMLSSTGCDVGQVRSQNTADIIKYSRYGYETLFTVGILHDIEIVISDAEWDGLLQDMVDYAADDYRSRPLTGNYRSATFIYKGPAGDAVIEEVGFRTKGHLNRPYPQDESGNLHRSHFKIKFNKVFDQEEGTTEWENRNQRRFAKLRELELRMNTNYAAGGNWDTSQMRELYSYELMRRAGVKTSRVGSARLWITIGEEKHYFGIYTLIEPVDKSFLTKRYGSDANDGNLYKCNWGHSGPANLGPIDDPEGFEHPLASDPRIVGVKDWQSHYRPTYDLKTNTDQPDHTVFLGFVWNLNTLSGEALKGYLDTNFEVDRFLRCLAMSVLIGKWDDYWSIGNNYYLYFNNDGKIEFYPTDFDMVYGESYALFDTSSIGIYEWGNHTREMLEIDMPHKTKDWLDQSADVDYPLVEKMFEIDEYRLKYEYYLAQFMKPENKLFVFSEYERTFNQLYALYSPYLDNEMNEGESMYISDTARRYFRDRTLSIVEELGLNEADYDIPGDASEEELEFLEVRRSLRDFMDEANVIATQLLDFQWPVDIEGEDFHIVSSSSGSKAFQEILHEVLLPDAHLVRDTCQESSDFVTETLLLNPYDTFQKAEEVKMATIDQWRNMCLVLQDYLEYALVSAEEGESRAGALFGNIKSSEEIGKTNSISKFINARDRYKQTYRLLISYLEKALSIAEQLETWEFRIKSE